MPVPLSDEARHRDLVRTKSVATGLLVGAALVYLVADRAVAAGAPGWVGFGRAAAEAGLVGGLADWFAVTALFRRPLGLPIPHTAIVPTRKDALGRSLGEFVGTNFLSEQVVRDRLRGADVARRVGGWLAADGNAERVGREVAGLARAGLRGVREEDVQAVLDSAVLPRLAALPAGPPVGRLLHEVVSDDGHRGLVDLAAERALAWLEANRDLVVRVVAAQAPPWSPRFVDERVAARVHTELVRVAREVRAEPRHPLRDALDRFLLRLADELRHDPDTMARADRLKVELLDRPEVRQALRDIVGTARRVLIEVLDDPGSELRQRLVAAVRDLGRRLVEDETLRARADAYVADAAAYVVTRYGDELTRTITETVERWDAGETARKIELQVGRDLQFIRLNGTVVGALAGLAIHAVTRALG